MPAAWRFGLLSCFLLCFGSAKSMTHEDLWLMPRVAPPVVSPDGRQAVFAVTEPAYEADAQVVDLWLVATDGAAPPRRLTHTKGAEAAPAWSADSRRIAFAARREGDAASQIYILDLETGGEAQRATAIATGARAPQFSPDGTRILFISNVIPGAANEAERRQLEDERKARKHSARVFTGFPIRNWDRWMDERRPSLFVQTLGEPEARDLLAGSALFTSEGYGGRVGLGSDDLDAAWAGDGQSIVLAASANRNRSAYAFTNIDLWRVPLSGGEPQRLTGKADGSAADSFSAPRFTRDGRHFFALVAPRTDRVYSANRIARFEARSGREVSRIEAPEGLSVGSYALSADGNTI